MSDRVPLVHDAGAVRELPAGDALLLDGARLGARSLAGRDFPAMRGGNWGEQAMQGRLDRMSIARWQAVGASSTINAYGGQAFTAQGTVTSRSPAATNMVTRARRVGAVSASGAGSACGWYFNSLSAAPLWTVGDGSGLGGFFAVMRFAPSDAASVSGARMFVGMATGGSAATNVDPAALTDAVGVAALSGSANLNIVFGGSAAQAPVDLGTSFPANGLSADLYELILSAAPGSADVGWRVERLNTWDVAGGTLSNTTPGTTLPAASTFLAPRLWRSNNSTALAVGIDLLSVSIETQI